MPITIHETKLFILYAYKDGHGITCKSTGLGSQDYVSIDELETIQYSIEHDKIENDNSFDISCKDIMFETYQAEKDSVDWSNELSYTAKTYGSKAARYLVNGA